MLNKSKKPEYYSIKEFDEIYQKFYKLIWRWVGNDEDAFQWIWMRFFEKLKEGKVGKSPNYVMVVLKNFDRQRYRKSKIKAEFVDFDSVFAESDFAQPDFSAEVDDLISVVESWQKAVSPLEYSIAQLSAIGYSTREIAKKYGRSGYWVCDIRKRALNKLRELI